MTLNDVASPRRLPMYAAEPSVLGSHGVQLTLQADDAISERREASVHGEFRT